MLLVAVDESKVKKVPDYLIPSAEISLKNICRESLGGISYMLPIRIILTNKLFMNMGGNKASKQ